MKIKISNLADSNYDFEFEDDVKKLELDEVYNGKFQTKVNLSKFQDQIILDSNTEINAHFACDRCATEFDSVISSQYKMVYLLRNNDVGNESVDVTYVSRDADYIDIRNDVRDYAMLSVPMKKLCTKDCKGLCPKCGKNLNEGKCNCSTEQMDIRWQPLMELKNKLKTN
jgi:DUF177 domain-containing protein